MSLSSIASAVWKALAPSTSPAVTSEQHTLAAAIGDVIEGKATVYDAMTIVDFAWSIAVDVNPGLLALSSAEGFAVALLPLMSEGVASGIIQPDTDPIHDAQTQDTPHMGRRG